MKAVILNGGWPVLARATGLPSAAVVASLLALAVEFEAKAVGLTVEDAAEKQIDQVSPKTRRKTVAG